MTNGRDLSAINKAPQPNHRLALGWYLFVLMLTQTLRLNLGFVVKWGAWLFANPQPYIDLAYDKRDRKPILGEIASQMKHWLRYPRSSIKSLFHA